MRLSKRNRRGIFYLILLGVIIAYTPRLVSALSGNSTITISTEELKQLDEEFRKRDKSSATKKAASNKTSRYSAPASKFDPNMYTRSDWMKLGLSEKQADVVLKFSKNGIDSDHELRTVYVISDELYALIKDSTYYPEKDKKIDQPEQLMVDLNKSNEEVLQKLPGIGPYYAKKIVEYRKEVGGYHSPEQLLELWKFDADKLETIRPFITMSGEIRQISINVADIEELKSHPYISYKVANSIVKMRSAHGNYQSIDELTKSKLIDAELLDKLRPYIKL